MKTKMRRSLLYVPGDSRKMLEKSASSAADLLLLNLEDGVAAAMKEEARGNVVRALGDIDFGSHEVVVRVNPPETATGRRDLEAVVAARPHGVCLPKVESAREVESAAAAIAGLEAQAGLEAGSVRIHAMIESARGVLSAPDIAAAPRVASLVFGSADYVADVRCQPGDDRRELLLALEMIVLAARAAGVDAIDAPCFDVRNQDILRREAAHARRLGFDGKSALHPEQAAIINRIFDVTPGEIAWAERTLAELDAAEQRGKALTTVGGQLLDNPHRLLAERILARRP